MKITVLGATGNAGSRVVSEALSRVSLMLLYGQEFMGKAGMAQSWIASSLSSRGFI